MRSFPHATKRLNSVFFGTIAAGVALAAAACGSSPASSAKPSTSAKSSASAKPSASASATHHPMTGETIGSDCGMIPSSAMHSMGMEPLLTAASHNPLLTVFAAAASRAGLTADLNSMHSFTVFAPANSAFANLPAATMSMLHMRAELAKILKYHVVSGTINPAQIARGATVTSLAGSQLKLSKMGSVYEVNNATVLCGNLPTENATVYVISKLLTPMH